MSYISAHPSAIPPAIEPPARAPSSLSESLTHHDALADNPESISPWQSVYHCHTTNRPETPFIKRVSSVRLPDDDSQKTTDQLPNLLNLDLCERDGTIHNDVSDMIIMIIRFVDHITYVN
jgi:hypothetical protein